MFELPPGSRVHFSVQNDEAGRMGGYKPTGLGVPGAQNVAMMTRPTAQLWTESAKTLPPRCCPVHFADPGRPCAQHPMEDEVCSRACLEQSPAPQQ